MSNVALEIELYEPMRIWLQQYLEDKYKDTDSTKASKFMFEKAKVECIRLKPRAEKIEISFKTQD